MYVSGTAQRSVLSNLIEPVEGEERRGEERRGPGWETAAAVEEAAASLAGGGKKEGRRKAKLASLFVSGGGLPGLS